MLQPTCTKTGGKKASCILTMHVSDIELPFSTRIAGAVMSNAGIAMCLGPRCPERPSALLTAVGLVGQRRDPRKIRQLTNQSINALFTFNFAYNHHHHHHHQRTLVLQLDRPMLPRLPIFEPSSVV